VWSLCIMLAEVHAPCAQCRVWQPCVDSTLY
jgi:hypothetical protein